MNTVKVYSLNYPCLKSNCMNDKEKLELYLERLRLLALEKIEGKNTDVISALKESLHIIEGEMLGY